MSENTNPTFCPYCNSACDLTWYSVSAVWYCNKCQARFKVLGCPSPEPAPAERKDLIAKAYRGRLSVVDALYLIECFMWRIRAVVKYGKPHKTAVTGPGSDWPVSDLEITP